MKGFDPKHAAENGYTKADWDAVDSPEFAEEELATARPFAEGLPELAATIRRSRGPRRAPEIGRTLTGDDTPRFGPDKSRR